MTADEAKQEPEYEPKRHHRGRHAFIPAGILIGLGIGLLAGYPASGVLIGLGLGFLAAAFVPLKEPAEEATSCTSWKAGKNLVLFILGIFFIIIGIGLVVAPPYIWTYLIPLFLILLGIWFAIRAFTRKE